MKIALAQVNGDGVEGNAGYGVEGAVQGIEVQEIVGLLADQDLAYLLAEHLKAQARGAQCIENGILCGPVDLLGGGAVRAHLHHFGRRRRCRPYLLWHRSRLLPHYRTVFNKSLPWGESRSLIPFQRHAHYKSFSLEIKKLYKMLICNMLSRNNHGGILFDHWFTY